MITRASIRPYLAGASLAAFLVVGTWHPGALFGSNEVSRLFEPRLWFLVLLLSTAAPSTKVTPAPPQGSFLRLVTFSLLSCLAVIMAHGVGSYAPDTMVAAKFYDVALIACAAWGAYRWTISPDYRLFLHAFWLGLLISVGGLAAAALVGLATGAGLTQGIERGDRVAVIGGGPNTFARNMAVLLIAAIWARRETVAPLWVTMGVGAIAAALLILSGSRSALAAVLAALVVVAIAETGILKSVRVGTLTGVGAFVALQATGAFDPIIAQLQGRFLPALETLDLGERAAYYAQAWDCAQGTGLLGIGLSGFQELTGLGYPHNTFLEVWCEAGLLGVITLAGFVGVVCVGTLIWRHHIDWLLVSLWGFSIVAAQFTGGIYDNRSMFILPVLLAASASARMSPAERGEGRRSGLQRLNRP